jgi:transcriptional regulator with XRE-family HTH domain
MRSNEIGARIRKRRLERSWTVRDLARRAGVSASYISLIENGQKVPTPSLAAMLAKVLEDDPRLYLAWAEALRQTNLDATSRIIREYEARLRTPEVSLEIVTPDDIQVESGWEVQQELPDSLRNWLRAEQEEKLPPLAARKSFFEAILPGRGKSEEPAELDTLGAAFSLHEEIPGRARSTAQKSEDILNIPLFLEGAHPADSKAEMLGNLRVNKKVVPQKEVEHLVNPFAWRLSGHGTRRVHRLLRPRDLVVISEDLKKLEFKEIFAVRHQDELVLSHILRKGSVTLLLSSQGESDIEVLEGEDPESALVGRVALVIRAWHYAVFSPTDYEPE